MKYMRYVRSEFMRSAPNIVQIVTSGWDGLAMWPSCGL
jgi:hypothetical protein